MAGLHQQPFPPLETDALGAKSPSRKRRVTTAINPGGVREGLPSRTYSAGGRLTGLLIDRDGGAFLG